MARRSADPVVAEVLNRAESALREFGTRRIVAAVSGGVDSVAMLDLLCALQRPLGLSLAVAHLNHQLRRSANADARFVQLLAHDRGLPFFTESVNVAAAAARDHVSAEMAGRAARYAFFARVLDASSFDAVATAHSRTDVAESLVMHLARGSGLYGLTGIPPMRKLGDHAIIRPVLEIDKDALIAYATARGLPWREDRTNRDRSIPRNRVRHAILPELHRLNPRFAEAAARTARIARSTLEHLRPEIDAAKADLITQQTPAGAVSIGIQALKRYFTVLQSTAVYEILRETFPDTLFGADDVDRLVALAGRQTGGRTLLEGGIVAQRDRSAITVRRGSADPVRAVSLAVNASARVGAWLVTARNVARGTVMFDPTGQREFVDADAAGTALTVRPWRAGDALVPLGMRAKKKVSDLLTDRKVPTGARHAVLVVESNGMIVWVCGHRINDRVKLTRDSRRVLELSITPADTDV